MTDREKAIVMAHTGICMLEGEKLGVFYQYLNELYGRLVYTHEWMTLDIKEKSKPDFLQLCKEEEPDRRGRWLKGDKMADYPRIPYKAWETYCSCCGEIKEQTHDNFCGNCGASMDEVEE